GDGGGGGGRLLSLPDRDTVDGQPAARLAAAEHGLISLTGMEVSLTVAGRLYHVLAYDFDPGAPTWTRFAELRRAQRDGFIVRLFDQLNAKGYVVSPDLARDEQGHFVASPLSAALTKANLATSMDAARGLLRNLGLSFPPELGYLDVHAFAEVLRPGDAVFSVAHPARNETGVSVRLSEEDLLAFTAAIPLVALEAYHPYHAPADVEYFAHLAAQHGLAVTCGSDAHGRRFGGPLRRHPASLARDFLGVVRDRWEARVPVFSGY